MVIEELIAKLGLKFSGGNDAARFLRELDKIKRATRDVGKGLEFKVGNKSGLSRMAADAERAARAFRKMREEAAKASRVRFLPGGIVPGGGTRLPGRGPGGGAVAGAIAGRASAGGAGAGALAGVASVIASLNRFGNLEAAQIELTKTLNTSKEELQSSIDRFVMEGPKLGAKPIQMVEAMNAFAAAGLDRKTSEDAAITTARAGKAGTVPFDQAAAAAIVSMQNLGIKVEDLGKAFDIMIAGGKLGKAEFKEMAPTLPQLATSGAKIGMKGLTGLLDISSALTVVRESSATTAQAADFLRDFMEKMSSPEMKKTFKKEAKIDLEKEMGDADKKGESRLDRMIKIAGTYTKGNAFRLAELAGDMQARTALGALIEKQGEYEANKGTINREAAGTTDRDLAKTMDGFNASVDRATAALDRLAINAGALLSGTARAGLDMATAADQAARDGKGSTPEQANATISKLNRIFGKPGGASAAPVVRPPSFASPRPTGLTAPTFGSLGDRANWMSQGAAKAAGVTNNYENTGNDQRTQSVHISQTVNGVPGVAAAAAEGTKSGLASMGASIVKGNSVATGTANAP